MYIHCHCEQKQFSDGFVNRYTDDEINELCRELVPQERVQVDLRNVSVCAQTRAQTREFDNVWQTLMSPLKRLTGSAKERVDILSNITTSFTPGSLCVIIGPPQCGKSTLLKLISGQDDPGLFRTGDFTYNNRKIENWRLRRLATYVQQVDYHFPALTVQETFEFSARITNDRVLRDVADTPAGKRLKLKADKPPSVEIVKTKMGLAHVADTKIGDSLTRGVSGGERKRVTVEEMFCIETQNEVKSPRVQAKFILNFSLNKI